MLQRLYGFAYVASCLVIGCLALLIVQTSARGAIDDWYDIRTFWEAGQRAQTATLPQENRVAWNQEQVTPEREEGTLVDIAALDEEGRQHVREQAAIEAQIKEGAGTKKRKRG